ncbi:hypothetical protein ScalyP_jg4350 [Parmales sp. scaly parma]|nr:hypothetical protein ScalyP_jg4350 [Parmales sp. scaly parma]
METRSLFKGLAAPFYSSVGVKAVIFSTYKVSLSRSPSNKRSPREGMHRGMAPRNTKTNPKDKYKYKANFDFWKSFVSGCFSGFVQCLIICPTEHIKCRLQAQKQSQFRSTLHATTSILKTHGLGGLYRGWSVSCAREIPSFGVYFASYDLFKEKLLNTSLPNWTSSVLACGLSGSLTWICVYPIDMAKTIIQTMPMDTPAKERR